MGIDWAQIHLAGEIRAGQEIDYTTRLGHSAAASWIAGAQVTCVIVTAIVFLLWLMRVRINVRALGARRLRYRREWTVVGFLVPFLNALRPYQVIREIWMASDPRTGGPLGWHQARAPRLLLCWWLSFVAFGLLEPLSHLMIGGASSPSGLRFAHVLALVADICAAASASLAHFVVDGITEAQDDQARRDHEPRSRRTSPSTSREVLSQRIA